jgi:D-arabinose 1-dehydrogenase-like Zn-dependent alcohol dehydrogenase
MALVLAGKVRPTVSELIDWKEIPAGLKRLHDGHSRGKIVARIG